MRLILPFHILRTWKQKPSSLYQSFAASINKAGYPFLVSFPVTISQTSSSGIIVKNFVLQIFTGDGWWLIIHHSSSIMVRFRLLFHPGPDPICTKRLKMLCIKTDKVLAITLERVWTNKKIEITVMKWLAKDETFVLNPLDSKASEQCFTDMKWKCRPVQASLF